MKVEVAVRELDPDLLSVSDFVPVEVRVAVGVSDWEKVGESDGVRVELLEIEMVSVSVSGRVAVGVQDKDSLRVVVGVGGGVFD